MKIAVEGCAHGELDKIYEAIELLEKQNCVKVDLLIICGDFQAVRNSADIQCMAVPQKFRKLNTFYKYYSGEKKAPILTIFVGGNHEASNYLSELPYGGWVCPNIFYLGYANVINIGGVRIAGVSGIYKGNDYMRGHFEYPPYDDSTKRSVYHVRNIDVFRLKQIKKPIDIFISHDWPTGVYNYGNKEALLRWKPFFRAEMENNALGSKPAEELLMNLKPSYWFAAHLHCKFAALIPHEDNGSKKFTKFLALDKCLPRRQFLQLIDINSNVESLHIEYDWEWLSVLRLTNHLMSTSKTNNFMPGNGCPERWAFSPLDGEIESVRNVFHGDSKIPENFCMTAPPYNPSQENLRELKIVPYNNPQTEKLCEILNLIDPVKVLLKLHGNKNVSQSSVDPDEIPLIEDSPDEIDTTNTDLDVSSNTDLELSGCSFFIDKCGSHSETQDTTVSDSEQFSFPEIKPENLKHKTGDEMNVNEVNPLKKFKRRNYSLYNSS